MKNYLILIAILTIFSNVHASPLLTVDLSSGEPANSILEISELGNGIINFSSAAMTITMPESGDGVIMDPNFGFEPRWFGFNGLTLDIPLGSSVDFALLFGLATDELTVNLKPVNIPAPELGIGATIVGTRVSISENATSLLNFEINFRPGSITDLAMDWVSGNPQQVQVDINIGGAQGFPPVLITRTVASGLKHDGNLPHRWKIIAENDPIVSLTSITASELHLVPEPISLALFSIGFVGMSLFRNRSV